MGVTKQVRPDSMASRAGPWGVGPMSSTLPSVRRRRDSQRPRINEFEKTKAAVTIREVASFVREE
jgi:hypothetical protein